MKKGILIAMLSCATYIVIAQQKPAAAPVTKTVVATTTPPATPPPIVSTKELKKQLENNFKRKRFKAVIPIADTLLKRNKKDDNAFFKKVASKVMLKMDKSTITDLKGWFKNKDTAATVIAAIPYQFDFQAKQRSGEIYYKSAMAWAPKNGVPYLFYAAELADAKKIDEAISLSEKGYGLLNAENKVRFANIHATVLFEADKKEDAYSILEKELLAGNNVDENGRTFLGFYIKDEKYEAGIEKATELIGKDSASIYFVRRGQMYNKMGNAELACDDATILKNKFERGDYWLKSFACPQVMADVTPTPQRTYIYEVNFQNKLYDFRVTNPKVDMDNGVSFKFKMTGDVGINGKVNITKDAILTAHDQMNMFNKEDFTLTDKTTVWISKEVFNDFKTKGSSTVNASAWTGSLEFEVVDDENSDEDNFFTVKVDDEEKYIKCFKVVAKNGEQELWINDDPKNPIILKMVVDFSIELKQVL